jgi:hypothetical protein
MMDLNEEFDESTLIEAYNKATLAAGHEFDITSLLIPLIAERSPLKVENSQYNYKLKVQAKGKTGSYFIDNPDFGAVKTQNYITKTNGYYLIRKTDGGAIDTRLLNKMSIQQIKNQCDVTSLDNNLINKINTRILMAAKVDGQFIRSLINFINRDKPDYTIDMIMSLITLCLSKTLTMETQINLLKDSGITEMINVFKKDNIEKVPMSAWNAIFAGQFMKYLKIKMTTEWTNWHDTQKNLEKPLQDFQ